MSKIRVNDQVVIPGVGLLGKVINIDDGIYTMVLEDDSILQLPGGHIEHVSDFHNDKPEDAFQ